MTSLASNENLSSRAKIVTSLKRCSLAAEDGRRPGASYRNQSSVQQSVYAAFRFVSHTMENVSR